MKIPNRFTNRLAAGLRRVNERAKDERGVAVPLVAIVLVAMIGLTAVGVDTGRVATVATEAQTAADIAAVAGTIALIDEEDPEHGADEVLALNKIDGEDASTKLSAIVSGYMDPDYNFMAGGLPANAVRAQITATIDNVVLGAIGAPQSTLTREAIATFSGIGSAVPTLPIVIGECNYNTTCFDQSCMPTLGQAPNTTNNSAWTGYFSGTNINNVRSLMPPPVGDGNSTVLNVGDYINLTNGQLNLLPDVQRLLNDGQSTHVVPIVDCGGSANQAKQVRGFAQIEIDFVRATGNPKGIWLHSLWKGPQPGSPGGGQFGLLAVSLVK